MDGQNTEWISAQSTDKHENRGVTFEISVDGRYTVKFSFDFHVVDERDM